MKYLRQTIIALALGAHLIYTGDAQASDYNAYDTAAEILVLRPLALVGTIVGTAFFIGTSPLTGLASIAPPHDAFAQAADAFIVTPFNYTFKRPFGDYSEVR
ncbi:MAG: hypothetical protein ACREYF_20210 [Gammaproteobacteria bacterium]